jgi:hypothetical protein
LASVRRQAVQAASEPSEAENATESKGRP